MIPVDAVEAFVEGLPSLAILALVGLVAWTCLTLLFSPEDGALREWIWREKK